MHRKDFKTMMIFMHDLNHFGHRLRSPLDKMGGPLTEGEANQQWTRERILALVH